MQRRTPVLKIGSIVLANPLVLAPMAGYTESCTRRLAKRFGAALVTTEMVSAAGLTRKQRKTRAMLAAHPEEAPYAAQIFGSDPAEMAEAARIAEAEGAALVDINMGCPVRKVCKTGAGASLLRSPPWAARVMEEVRRAVSCPLTIKIRLGWDAGEITCLEIARLAEQVGVDAVTLHPRTRAQGFQGEADWSWVARLKEELRIPVIGSGDLFTSRRCWEVLRSGVCDGIMIARGARGTPWIFSEVLERLAGREPEPVSPALRHEAALLYLELLLEHYGKEDGLRRARFLLLHYTRGLPCAAAYRKRFLTAPGEEALRETMRQCFLEAASGSTTREPPTRTFSTGS